MARTSVPSQWELLQPLGSGSFAVVWLARHRVIHSLAAIKIILRTSIDNPDDTTRFTREISILKQLDHPFISELFEVVEDDEAFYLVMEYCEHGNLLNYVNTHGPLEEGRARRYFCQLISALDYLHNVKLIAHRDLKAENVLLDRNDNIRLIDFGLSKEFTKGTPTLMTVCGSPAYAAPEMIKGFPYTKAADMWSAGILLYAIVAGRLPFDDTDAHSLLQKVITDEPRYPITMSRCLVDLLKRLLTKDPARRITIDRLKEHPWFSQCQYALLIGFNATILDAGGVDREVVESMVRLGVDCRDLHDQLLTGALTEVTALYRQLKRNKLADRIYNFLDEMKKFESASLIRGHTSSPETVNAMALPLPRPTLVRIPPKRRLHSDSIQPQVVPGETRRNSRPMALSMPLEAQISKRPSFEAP